MICCVCFYPASRLYGDVPLQSTLLFGEVARHEIAVVRNVGGEQGAQTLDVIAPVAMQLAGHTEPAHQLRPRCLHARPGRVTRHLIEGARGVGDNEYVKALLNGGQGGEGHTDFGHHAGNDQLLAAGLLDGVDEILVVPGVDIAGARDVRRIGEQLLQFRHQWAVGAVLKAGGQNRGELEILADAASASTLFLNSPGEKS